MFPREAESLCAERAVSSRPNLVDEEGREKVQGAVSNAADLETCTVQYELGAWRTGSPNLVTTSTE